MIHRLLALATTAVCIAFTDVVEASSGGGDHPHQGKVTPFAPGDPNVKLDRKALIILDDGSPYQTQIQSGSSGRGLVVQDVRAPTKIVWDRILDYNNYAKMVPKTIESENYHVEKHRDGSQTIFTRMKVGFPMIKLQFFVKHDYQPKLNSLTWTLDYSKKSDFDDSCGYWYVVPHPDNPNWTRVYYSVEVSMFDWVPKFVVDFMSSKALTDATAWVKKYSEMEYEKQGGAMASGTKDDRKKTSSVGVSFGWTKKNKGVGEGKNDDELVSLVSSDPTALVPSNKKQVGLSRYLMILSVFVLSIYNVHLYFSQ